MPYFDVLSYHDCKVPYELAAKGQRFEVDGAEREVVAILPAVHEEREKTLVVALAPNKLEWPSDWPVR